MLSPISGARRRRSLVCVPDVRDQPDNAARVVVAGAGVRVSKKCSPAKLRRVIVRALEDRSLKHGARVMADALARKNGATTIADELELLPAPKAIQATTPAGSVTGT